MNHFLSEPDPATILAQNAEVIRALGKRVIGDIIEIGRRLTEAKQIVGHGNWLPWLDREFGWTDDTALNFMRVHDLAKTRNFRDLSLPISGLYMLAAPSTPEEAREAVIERAENGERLSVKDVRNLIEEARKKQEKETAERLAAREAEIRAEYVRGSWTRKPPPDPVTEQSYFRQFLRTKCHPVTEAVRLMDAEEFAGLVKSIRAHGQCYPIALVEHEGEWVVLDGRCREIACVIAGVEPKYSKIEVDDPCRCWASANLLRVHLNRSQQMMRRAILTEPDADEGACDPDQPPPPIVAARYVWAKSRLLADAVIKGFMSLDDAYEKAIDDAWRMQHASVDLDWLRSNFSLKEDDSDY